MQFNKDQIDLVARTFADVAKILFASSVIGFFIPGFSGTVNVPTFFAGSVFSVGFFIIGVSILKSRTL